MAQHKAFFGVGLAALQGAAFIPHACKKNNFTATTNKKKNCHKAAQIAANKSLNKINNCIYGSIQ